MNIQKMYELKEKLCRELENYVSKSSLSAGDISIIHDMLSSAKNIEKLIRYEDGEYSQTGDWRADIYGSYASGRSRGGRYSRTDGYSRDGDSMEMLQRLMDNARSDKEREALRHAMDAMR